ncbi:MAG: hypothetical protein BWY11_00926 [Firmicutes bacterium ADurb.Bin182]|nr:MAG: hypothetical protein BWY11_00926 [Firmicutes bacterium ADurb.Bin182]
MKKLLYILVLSLMLYGCAAQPIELAEIESDEAETLIQNLSASPSPAVSETIYGPLSIEPQVIPDEKSRIIVPEVSGCSEEDQINEAIELQIKECVKKIDEPVWSEYSIKINSSGILSVLVQLFSLKDNRQLAILPLTFDSATGDACKLSGFFDAKDERWRYVLPDIVEAQAKRRGITLLSDLLPVKDEQSYYLYDDSGESMLVLIFNPYEITTYAAGTPQFFIPLSDIEHLLGGNSALLRLL